MKPQDKHFQKKDIQTHLKHALLEDYIIRWASIIGNGALAGKIRKIHFVDGFAGRGAFLDGGAGSPKIAISNLFHLQQRFYEKYQSSNMRFIVHTVESHPAFQATLEELKSNSPFSSQIRNYKGKFEDHLTDILNQTNGSPALYFIDPFGYKGVRMDDIQNILLNPSHEVLVNVMTRSVGRNLSIENNHTEIKKFFGLNELPSNILEYLRISNTPNKDVFMNDNIFENLENDIVNLFKEQLHRRFQNDKIYTLSKRIYSKINPTQYFHLVFATRRREGLVAMKQSMADYESLKIQIENDFGIKNAFMEDLFTTDNQLAVYNYTNFTSDFITEFNNNTVPFSEIVDYYLQATPLPFRDNENSKKSIYDYFQKLIGTGTWIKTEGRAYAEIKKHQDIIVRSNIPKGMIKNLQSGNSNYEEQTLF